MPAPPTTNTMHGGAPGKVSQAWSEQSKGAGPTSAVGAGGRGVRKRKGCGEAGGARADTVNKKLRSLCPHQRKRSLCKECGGTGICSHQRIRSACKECGGASICPHQRIRSRCKECGGASLCPHQRVRSICKECGGASICPHQRVRSICKECGGASICPHQRIRSRCKECRAEADKSMPAGLEELEEVGV